MHLPTTYLTEKSLIFFRVLPYILFAFVVARVRVRNSVRNSVRNRVRVKDRVRVRVVVVVVALSSSSLSSSSCCCDSIIISRGQRGAGEDGRTPAPCTGSLPPREGPSIDHKQSSWSCKKGRRKGAAWCGSQCRIQGSDRQAPNRYCGDMNGALCKSPILV